MNINVNIFLNQNSDDDAVLCAISQLVTSETPASLWTQVANDTSYRPFHRAIAIRELVTRHFAKPMILEDAVRLLDGGSWLREAEVELIEAIGGEIPVRIPPGCIAFVIRLFQNIKMSYSRAGIYLVIDRVLDTNQLRNAFMSGATDSTIGQIKIIDFAFFPESLATTKR